MAFPSTKIQLCYWHAERAIKSRMEKTEPTLTQSQYRPGEAQPFIPDIEICWGSDPIRRPNGEHRRRTCNCPSRNFHFSPTDRIETRTQSERNAATDMFARHLNAHSIFSVKDTDLKRSQSHIHVDACQEMYCWDFVQT